MKIYAHRGASADFREMSRAAYLAAVEQGADGFECDLRLTKDRALICWHDSDLQRIAQSDLVISQSTLEELRLVTEILTFDELLEIAIAHRKDLALETKHPVPSSGEVERELLASLSRRSHEIASAGIKISIMSFSWWAIRRIASSGFSSVYLIAHRWQRFFLPSRTITATGPDIALLRGDSALGEKLRVKDRELFTWTVNSEEDLRAAYDAGVQVVMSDHPGVMKQILAQSKWVKP